MKREFASGLCRRSCLVLLLLLPISSALGYPDLLPLPPPSCFCNYSALYLPDLVAPHAYDIFLDIHFNPHPANKGINKIDEYVTGYANVSVSVAMPTQCLIINSSPEMNISSVTYFWKGKQYKGTAQATNPVSLQTVLRFNEVLQSTTGGNVPMGATAKAGLAASPYGLLNLEFSYRLSENSDGLSKTLYKDALGTHAIVATQFDPVAARKAFPCFDEPRFKTPFRISVVAPRLDSDQTQLATISNTKWAKRTVLGNGMRLRTDFTPTPPLSTFSVGILVGRLEEKEMTCDVPPLESPVIIRGWAGSEKIGLFDLGLQAACHSLATFTSIFNVSYPLPELNLVALPELATGGMIGLGFILFKQDLIVADPSTAVFNVAKAPIFMTAQGVASQWIGSMVTMSDWRDMWIRDGLVVYLGNLATGTFAPALATWQANYNFMPFRAFRADDSPDSRPLSGSEEEKTHYTSLLDMTNLPVEIANYKGFCLLRMLRAYLNGRGEQQGAASVLGNGDPQIMRRRSVQQQQQEAEVTSEEQEPDLAKEAEWAEEAELPVLPERQQQQDQSLNVRGKLTSSQYGPMGQPRMRQAQQQQGLRHQRFQHQLKVPGGEVEVTAAVNTRRSRSLLGIRRVARKLLARSTTAATTAATTTSEATLAAADEAVDPFFAALRVYVKENLYGSVTPQTLWEAMSRATGLDISTWMYDWTYSANFPVVEVSLSTNATGTIVHVDGSSSSAEPDAALTYLNFKQMEITDGGKKWWIPISYRLPDASGIEWLQSDHEDAVSVPLTAELLHGSNAVPPYVLVNPGRYGHYRVNYDPSLWAALAKAAVNTSAIPSGDLAAMIADASDLSWYGFATPPEVFFQLVSSLGARQQPEYDAQWHTTSMLTFLLNMLDSWTLLPENNTQPGFGGDYFRKCTRNLATFARDKIAIPLLVNMSIPTNSSSGGGTKRVGLSFSSVDLHPQDSAHSQLRMSAPPLIELAAITMVAAAKDKPAQLQKLWEQEPFKEAYSLRPRLGGKRSPAHADMRRTVYLTNILGNRGNIWEVTKKLYMAEKDPAERSGLLLALAHSPTVANIRKALNLTLSMPREDVEMLISTMGDLGGIQVAEIWNFVRQPENIDRLLALYGADSTDASNASSLGQTLQTLFGHFPDDSRAAEIVAWAAKYPGLMDSDIEWWLQQSVEYNQQTGEEFCIPVCNWLQQNL
ncbi:hypothetical protein Agub_g5274 [Astrephomene gubernaculifera]|uniref:Alpha-aminoacylpeptide hydrolase n=1 Tax=Astrephomene gubernaculifera TaxID=47775 RepID=A0AAD3DPA1_9CHLO|nr:hypothetical protein Agub_g5274 [Astrephomene gubernaculifera]